MANRFRSLLFYSKDSTGVLSVTNRCASGPRDSEITAALAALDRFIIGELALEGRASEVMAHTAHVLEDLCDVCRGDVAADEIQQGSRRREPPRNSRGSKLLL